MSGYANPYDGLVVTGNKSRSNIVVVDDFNYNLQDSSYATRNVEFQQADFVQLPDKLITPKEIANKKFEFTSNDDFQNNKISVLDSKPNNMPEQEEKSNFEDEFAEAQEELDPDVVMRSGLRLDSGSSDSEYSSPTSDTDDSQSTLTTVN